MSGLIADERRCELQALLLALHESHSGVRTAEFEFCDFVGGERRDRLVAHRASDGTLTSVRRARKGDGRSLKEIRRRMWISDGAIRVEIDLGRDVVVAVSDGIRWARRSADGQTEYGVLGSIDNPAPVLLAPPALRTWLLPSVMTLSAQGTGSCAGRATIVARGVPREDSGGRPTGDLWLDFDATHGTLLRRRAARPGATPIVLTECVRATYNGPVENACFDLGETEPTSVGGPRR